MYPNNTFTILVATVLIIYSEMLHAQGKPINQSVYNVEILIDAVQGPIGSDGTGAFAPADPSWIVQTANDTDGMPTLMLDVTPQVLTAPVNPNPDATCLLIQSDSPNWHVVGSAPFDYVGVDTTLGVYIGNTTGYFDYHVMSWENDAAARCMFHQGDENMGWENGLIEINQNDFGNDDLTEVFPNNSSGYRFRHRWRFTHGTKDSPLNFGNVNTCMTYSHANNTLHYGNNLNIKYEDNWTTVDDPAFNSAEDVTYIFDNVGSRNLVLSANIVFDGYVHLVKLDENNNLENHISKSSEAIDTVIGTGRYGIIIEGDPSGSSATGTFYFNMLVQDYFPSVATTFPDGIMYVNDDATGSGDGSSWDNAIRDLGYALSFAQPNIPIWVAQGIYKPTVCFNRNSSFFILDSIKVYGGLMGNEPPSYDLSLRDVNEYVSLLSGNIGKPDSSNDNSYNVVRTNDVSDQTIIDGFWIMHGNAENRNGGGLLNSSEQGPSSPQIYNCTFMNNDGENGSGMAHVSGPSSQGVSKPLLRNCKFEQGFASGKGGGFYNHSESNFGSLPRFENCTFASNLSLEGGGAICNASEADGKAIATFINCVFESNTSTQNGGAVFNSSDVSQSTVNFLDCQFNSNDAGDEGGALFTFTGGTIAGNFTKTASAEIITSIFDGNQALKGGAILSNNSEIKLTDCEFLNNSATTEGGAIFISKTSLYDERSTYNSNEGKNGNGGAIYGRNAQLMINGSDFESNEGLSGGAIYLFNSFLLVDKIYFQNNMASLDGGAIHGSNGSTIETHHSVFSKNQAGRGGAVAAQSTDSITISKSTFFSNSVSGSSGGAISIEGSSSNDISSSLFYKNFSGTNQEENDFNILASSVRLYNLAIQAESCDSLGVDPPLFCSGSMIYNIDPLLVDTSDIDGPDDLLRTGDDGLNILQNSPLIDMGTIANLNGLTDIAGQVHVNTPDIGAYEYPCTNELSISTGRSFSGYSSMIRVNTIDLFNTTFNPEHTYLQAGSSVRLRENTEVKPNAILEIVIDEVCEPE